MLAAQHEVDLIEVCAGRGIDLFAGEDRPGLGAPARIADHRSEISDDQNDRVPIVLEHPEHIKDDEMAYVQVGRGRVEAELDPQRISAQQALTQMVLDVDLDRPLTQALEKLPAHALQDAPTD